LTLLDIDDAGVPRDLDFPQDLVSAVARR